MTVKFTTPWRHPADGWSIASRAYARAMHAAGVELWLEDWQRLEQVGLDREVFEEMWPVISDMREGPVGVQVFSCALLSAEKMGVLDSMLTNEEPQAFYCVFERRGIERELVEKMRRLDGVWVQCRMNERVLREAGLDNVALHLYPFFDDDPHLALDKPAREPRHFYYIGRFEPRKAPDNVIRAFLRAFAPGQARLTIKTSPIPHVSAYPGAAEVVQRELSDADVARNGWTSGNVWQDVHVIEGRLSRQEMLQVHADGDVYVSASRGEGLELPAWDAKLSGRRLIVTECGGPEDFVDPEVDIRIPATGLVAADPSYPWGPGAEYIDYDLQDLIEAMQVARGQHACGTRTWPGWERHRAIRVGESLANWLESLSRDHRHRPGSARSAGVAKEPQLDRGL